MNAIPGSKNSRTRCENMNSLDFFKNGPIYVENRYVIHQLIAGENDCTRKYSFSKYFQEKSIYLCHILQAVTSKYRYSVFLSFVHRPQLLNRLILHSVVVICRGQLNIFLLHLVSIQIYFNVKRYKNEKRKVLEQYLIRSVHFSQLLLSTSFSLLEYGVTSF